MPHTHASGGDLIWRPTRLAIYARDGWRCAVCPWEPEAATDLRRLEAALRAGHGLDVYLEGRRATKGLTLDHVVPGHDHRPHNLVTMCLSCNSTKQDRPLRRFAPGAATQVRKLLRRRIDRELGRALCEELYPGWLITERRRRVDVSRRRRNGTMAAESPHTFFAALAAAHAA